MSHFMGVGIFRIGLNRTDLGCWLIDLNNTVISKDILYLTTILGRSRKEKISNSQNMNILYIILKHVIWRFQIYNLFREIFKFREDKSNNVFREMSYNAFVKPRNLNFSRNKLFIWNLQITCFKMIYNMFVF